MTRNTRRSRRDRRRLPVEPAAAADDVEGRPGGRACGNTVVVKPSEETPATVTLLGEVMNWPAPPGVVQRRTARAAVGSEFPPGTRGSMHHLHRREMRAAT